MKEEVRERMVWREERGIDGSGLPRTISREREEPGGMRLGKAWERAWHRLSRWKSNWGQSSRI
jgi:hypothetical protein